MTTNKTGPQFVKYFEPLVSALKELGNSGTPSEVRDLIIKKLQIPDEVIDEQLKGGNSRFENQVAWARFYLVKAEYIDASKRGVWNLTEKGINAELNHKKALQIFKEVQQESQPIEKQKDAKNQNYLDENDITAPALDDNLITINDYRQELLEILRNLSPAGFEKLCQRFLRESGFQEVEVTGKSGDGGIDGKGILQINPLISIPVLFQCKRYTGSVSPSQIRDFRGAMIGRAEKGIFITTGTFTIEARRESVREGVSPIELVDYNKLIAMLETLELGLISKTIYVIDYSFFKEFE